jgi:hypothetical protein
MRTFLPAITFCIAMAAVAVDAPSSLAQSPNQHPYCALDSSSGATSCYYDTRAACGPRCIDNPGYVGAQRATTGAMDSVRRRSPRY